MIKVIVNGYRGKLGGAICKLAESEEEFEVVAGIDVSGKANTKSFPTFQNINDCDMPADVLIDCTIADAVPQALAYAVKRKMPIVICTTGLSEQTIESVHHAAKEIPVFRSANMSLGINLIASAMEKMVNILADANFDIEIIEKHHNQKVDAPSGTALLLADAINAYADGFYEYQYDRSKVREKRNKKELGIHAIRGGNIVGEHSIIFAGIDETIEIKHTATSKEVFAVGALKAAKFIAAQANGLYDMKGLING